MILSDKFVEQIKALLPDEHIEFFNALNENPSISIRLNPVKSKEMKCTSTDQVSWCANGFYLDEREKFTFDPLFHAGAYYVQDASSMIVSHIIKSLPIDSPVRYLDLCAAPGGKSTAAIDALPAQSLMVSNEINGTRAQVLRENMIKWGYPHCVVTNNDSAAFGKLRHYFDIIAVDAPCSGEGMFRKDEVAVSQWTPDLVAQCALRQKEIIDNIWDALRPGGYMIYSTCTYNRDENEDMLQYIIDRYGATSIPINMNPSWGIHNGIKTECDCYRFLPHKVNGEGLFIGIVQKPDSHITSISFKPKKAQKIKYPETISSWLSPTTSKDYKLSTINDTISAVHSSYERDVEILVENLRVIHAGIPLGTMKGKDIIPHHALAMSNILSDAAFPIVELDYATAISYLQTSAINLPADAPRGINIVTFNGLPLGFVKNIGNRANNMYPKEWRIRSAYPPEYAPCILS